MAAVVDCSVCKDAPGNAGSMQCGHSFCHDCFARYVDGSVEELRTHLRCCICGWLNILVTEVKDELPLNDFGRNRAPRLKHPVGMSMRKTGDFVVTDAAQQRVFIFDRRGSCIRDFAYLHKYKSMTGNAVNHDDRIIIPVSHKDRVMVLFYNIEGAFLQSAFLESSCNITGVVVNALNHIIVADCSGSCLHILDDNNRLSFTVRLPQLQGESHRPHPNGLALNDFDNVFVSDSANHCVKVFDQDGQFLYKFGSLGERAGQFNCPAGIAIDEANRIIVADKGNQRVQLFDKSGEFLCYIVRYNIGSDVYVAPTDVTSMGNYQAAVMLQGTKDTQVGEARIYDYKNTLRRMNYHSELMPYEN